MALLLDTAGVPAAERFGAWREAITGAFFPVEVRNVERTPFQGRLERYALGPLDVFAVRADASAQVRTGRCVDQGDPEQLQLHLLRRGRCRVTQQHRRGVIQAGDLTSFDSSAPFVMHAPEPHDLLIFSFPKVLLSPYLGRLGRCTALRVPNDSGMAARTADFLCGLVDGLRDGSVPEHDSGLADSVIGLLRALYSDDSPDSRPAPLLSRIRAFAEAHLHEPGLGPDRIAEAHFISTRYLHKMFESQELSVARWIRQRRLERCRRDLADRALSDESIRSLSRRWGFVDADHFSHTFRAAYGCAPRQFRERALRRERFGD